MEFLLYLNPDAQQIIQYVRRAQFKISENNGLCRDSQLFGITSAEKRKFVVCTNNIKNSGLDLKHYINETVLHESVHVAQYCRGSAFWISKGNMPLSAEKLKDVSNSAKKARGSSSSQNEHEAYWMEDKPKEVIYVLQKYCL